MRDQVSDGILTTIDEINKGDVDVGIPENVEVCDCYLVLVFVCN
jgi:hypothetical protein